MNNKGKGKGSNPNSKKALEPTKWKKGQAVPGAGRPKGSLGIKERLARFMEMPITGTLPDGTQGKMTVADTIALSLIAKSQLGDVPAIREIFDRYFGKETQPIDLTAKEETIVSMEERIKKYAKSD